MGKMEIASKSIGSFQLKGKRATLLINPSDNKLASDGVILTKQQGNNYAPNAEEIPRLIIQGPGEYEIGGISVSGRNLGGETAFRIGIEGIALLYLPNAPADKAILEQFGQVDILLLGDYNDGIYELEPKIIIPFTQELGEKLGKEVASEKKLSITKEKLPQDLKVVIIHG